MKYLHIPELSALSDCMAGRHVGDMVLDGRLEAYSCASRRAPAQTARARA